MRIRKPGIFEANNIYLMLGLALLYVGYLVQSREIITGLLITEYILIFLPNIVYLKFRGYSLKGVLRLNPISFKQSIIIIFIMLFAYPIAVFLNAIFIAFFNSFSSAVPTSIPIPTNPFEFFIGMIVVAISPGICEEIMFRGTMVSAYEKLGYSKCIVITSILFGIFHFNVLNFIGPTFLGIILSVILFKTNSIFSSILGHILNNGIALTIGYFITKYSNQIDEFAINNTYIPESYQIIMSLSYFAIIALISGIVLIRLINLLPVSNNNDFDSNLNNVTFSRNNFRIIIYIPLAIVFIIYIVLNYKMLFNV